MVKIGESFAWGRHDIDHIPFIIFLLCSMLWEKYGHRVIIKVYCTVLECVESNIVVSISNDQRDELSSLFIHGIEHIKSKVEAEIA